MANQRSTRRSVRRWGARPRLSGIAFRCLILLAAVALLAGSCSSGQESPSLSATRPDEAAAPEPAPAPAQVEQTTSETAPPATAPPGTGEDDSRPISIEEELPPPIDMSGAPSTTSSTTSTTRPAEFVDPEITKLPSDVTPVSDSFPPIRERAAPAWQPQRIMVAKPNLREIIPVYDAPNGTQISFKDGPLWSYTYRGNQLVVRVLQGSEGDEWVEAELPMRPWDNRDRPNGVRGWVRTENFDWRTVTHHIQIDLSDENGNPSVDFWNGDT